MWLRTLILHFCQWCNNSYWGHGVRDSVWLFPFVEIFHLLALGVLGGTILILNLRLIGFRFQDDPSPNSPRMSGRGCSAVSQ